MTIQINQQFANELKKYGAGDFDACFNCGTCSAICSLTNQKESFPRKFIRQGMLGQKDEILNSKELWLCYACGECTENCPRQAAPGNYMAAMRRYAIAGYEPTGLTKLLFKNNFFSIFITLLLAVILGLFLLTIQPSYVVSRWIFRLLPYEIIHITGLVIFIITGLSILWGVITMWYKLMINKDKNTKKENSFFNALSKVAGELAAMKRYRDCDTEEYSFWQSYKFYTKPWFVHWTIMWGFIGLLMATVLDFMLKDPATDIWWPARILGSFSGILLVYGTSISIYYRRNQITKTYTETRLADWMFLIFLWLAGITGFWLEIAVTFHTDFLFNHYVLIFHTILSMELVLLFAFSKFAHAIYRPIALFVHFYN